MKKTFFVLAAAAVLCACAGNVKKINQVKPSVWELDPMNMCSELIEQNITALYAVCDKYGDEAASAVAPLYQELDLRSNAVCRSRIVRREQIARLQELRAEYIGRIEEVLKEYKD